MSYGTAEALNSVTMSKTIYLMFRTQSISRTFASYSYISSNLITQ